MEFNIRDLLDDIHNQLVNGFSYRQLSESNLFKSRLPNVFEPGIDKNAFFISCALIKINGIIVLLHALVVNRIKKILVVALRKNYFLFNLFLNRLHLWFFFFFFHVAWNVVVL